MSERCWTLVDVLGPDGMYGAAAEDWAAACAAALAPTGCLGSELVLPEEDRPRLRAYYSLDTVGPSAAARAALAGAGVDAEVAGEETLTDPGWVEQFNASLKPVDVGRSFTILPRGGEAPPGRVALRIAPGRAFGTGHHASTRLALSWLEDVMQPGAKALDAGTGTGILACAAAALGARRVLAFDVDPEAVEVARENVALLGERERAAIELAVAARPAGGERFDVVLANIQVDVIIAMLDDLLLATAPRGTLILAGLLKEDEPVVISSLTFRDLRADWRREGEWSAARVRP